MEWALKNLSIDTNDEGDIVVSVDSDYEPAWTQYAFVTSDEARAIAAALLRFADDLQKSA